VEGAATDERIYGTYGPAPARDVLNQLLDGSGYNVLMVGDKGEGTPRELVLTARSHAAAASTAANGQVRQSAEEDQPEEPEPVEPVNPGLRRPFGIAPAQPGRSPEQIMNEMQQRQQQLQQAQPQNQQPQNQQPPVPQPQNPQPPND
jgi:hypothetical protein